MIKIGIDPSGTGTTGIVVYEDNKLIEKQEFTNKDWEKHNKFIYNIILTKLSITPSVFINIEDCLYTNANGSKDRDDLLRLLGAVKSSFNVKYNWVSPRHTKSIVKNIENESKYCGNKIYWRIDSNLTYQYGKGWKYNNEKISNHIRDAIIIANYESK